jgi:hypothetical protein
MLDRRTMMDDFTLCPEQEAFASSAGISIDSGRGYFALPQEDIHATERVVAHDLCHACVAHLPIPLWGSTKE